LEKIIKRRLVMLPKECEEKEQARMNINAAHHKNGVNFIDIKTAYIDESVKIGTGTTIYPCVTLSGNVVIGENCVIGQNTRVVDSVIGDRTEIQQSVVLESRIGSDTTVGPFAYLRPNSDIGNHCKVGDFVEVKNSSMADGAKASHLTYIGDSDVGRDVNLGCGVVFVNYDGAKKYRSVVKDGAFVGCNVNIISPVVIEQGAYIAAGSTVTGNVPADSLCVERGKQRIIEGWALKRGILKNKV
jgi:bifunctional UDP-N-acetylglucosamine pyrophosphorylase/glucosamine-1-phosphate N-acetyltransferase